MSIIRSIDTVARLADRLLAAVAGIALIVMMFFTVADMVLRGIGRPLAGSYEVIGWLSATAVALALGYAQRHQGHVGRDGCPVDHAAHATVHGAPPSMPRSA